MAILKKIAENEMDEFSDPLPDYNLGECVEDDTAEEQFLPGRLIVYRGDLYEVTEPINIGDEFVIGGNMEPTTMDEIMQRFNVMPCDVIGSVHLFAGNVVPEGYLLCNGQEVSRETYSALFTVIGTTWGEGDGLTTFNVPDMREVAPVGVGTSTRTEGAHDVYALGEFKDDQIQEHTHSIPAQASSSGGTATGCGMALNNSAISSNGVSVTRKGDVTRGKRMGINYIIKYADIVTHPTKVEEDSHIRYDETTDYIQVKKNSTWYNYKYFNPSAPYALIPTMTSNTTPEGIASGTVDSSNAYKVFDGDDITTWGVANSSTTDTVSYEFASPVKCSSYRLVISPLFNVSDHTVNIDVQTLDGEWTNVVTLTVPHVTTCGDTRTYTGDIDFNESIKAIRVSDNGGYYTTNPGYYHFINSFQLYGYIA